MERSVSEVIQTSVTKHQLGVILCQCCGEIIDTVPTNGVKTLYGICDDNHCRALAAHKIDAAPAAVMND
ncbi:GapA-binding peptide SR1P [Paenibacillus sp. MBLB4367]|uniref:GapA-binding peptide SR1P n=1 Tax=Paenibacillus sp. MBLB4367 TaxID=3384767 RepID=UPI00390842B7